MLNRKQLVEALRLYGDVASAGDKGHWGLVMREAATMLLADKDALELMIRWSHDETLPEMEVVEAVKAAIHGARHNLNSTTPHVA